MAPVELYIHWFEHEKASNQEMLAWLTSVPVENRSDPKFNRAVVLAGHLAACRENWLDRMLTGGKSQTSWWPDHQDLESLPDRYRAMEAAWTAYLASLTDQAVLEDFEFHFEGGSRRWNIEGQLMQLVGHSFYHRGQISLLVEQLGGKSEDTDYLYWRIKQEPERWSKTTKS